MNGENKITNTICTRKERNKIKKEKKIIKMNRIEWNLETKDCEIKWLGVVVLVELGNWFLCVLSGEVWICWCKCGWVVKMWRSVDNLIKVGVKSNLKHLTCIVFHTFYAYNSIDWSQLPQNLTLFEF